MKPRALLDATQTKQTQVRVVGKVSFISFDFGSCLICGRQIVGFAQQKKNLKHWSLAASQTRNAKFLSQQILTAQFKSFSFSSILSRFICSQRYKNRESRKKAQLSSWGRLSCPFNVKYCYRLGRQWQNWSVRRFYPRIYDRVRTLNA